MSNENNFYKGTIEENPKHYGYKTANLMQLRAIASEVCNRDRRGNIKRAIGLQAS
jgi:hypothetical protein